MKTLPLQNNLQQPLLIKLLFITLLLFQFTTNVQALTPQQWNFSFATPDNEEYFDTGSRVYVRVAPDQNRFIDYMELFIDNQFIRRENRFPYEWGKRNSNNDHELRNMQPGTYTLKVKVLDTDGDLHEKTRVFYIGNNNNNLIPFKIKVKTDNSGTSNNNQFEVPMITGNQHSYDIDCDSDGQIDVYNKRGSHTCTYPSADEYTIVFFLNILELHLMTRETLKSYSL